MEPGICNADIPCPTNDDACAKIVGYSFWKNNKYQNLRKEQRTFIKADYGVTGEVSRCKCKENVDQPRCCSNKCDNFKLGIACPIDCGIGCGNNPWERDGFAAGKKTVLQWTQNKGYGIFACGEIHKNEFIGEYTGMVYDNGKVLNGNAVHYSLSIEGVDQKIDAFKQGSICRCINHSCKPNCYAVMYVHNRALKVVYIALEAIHVSEELTVDYGWTFAEGENVTLTACMCGAENCKKFIEQKATIKKNIDAPSPPSSSGEDYDPGKDILSTTSRNDGPLLRPRVLDGTAQDSDKDSSDDSASDDDGDHVSTPEKGTNDDHDGNAWNKNVHPPSLVRPDDYVEKHNFGLFSSVYTFREHNGILQAVPGRVVKTYNNKAQIQILAVESKSTVGTIQHVPHWMCFQYREEAMYRIQNAFQDEEKMRIITYLKNGAVGAAAWELERDLAAEYVKRVTDSNFPKLALGRTNVHGPVAVGYPTFLLTETSADFPSQVDQQKQLLEEKRSATVEPELQGWCEDEYNPFFRKSVKNVKKGLTNSVRFTRIFDSTCELVSVLAYSRLKEDRSESQFSQIQATVRKELNHYYNLLPQRERRFMFSSQYRFACEVESTGSWHLLWCSLCKSESTFATEYEMKRHFRDSHSIVAQCYKCTHCREDFFLPSLFRKHASERHPKFAARLVTETPSYILDAYHDAINCISVDSNSPLHLVQLGLPSLKHPKELPARLSKKRGVVQMDKVKCQVMVEKCKSWAVEFPVEVNDETLQQWKVIGQKKLESTRVIRGKVDRAMPKNAAGEASSSDSDFVQTKRNPSENNK